MPDNARPPVAIRIVRPYETEEEFLAQEIETVGKTTVILLGAQPRPAGVILRFEVTLASGVPLLRGEGRVITHREHAFRGQPGLGLRFTRLDPRSKAFVDRAAALRESQPPPGLHTSSAPPPVIAPTPTEPPPPAASTGAPTGRRAVGARSPGRYFSTDAEDEAPSSSRRDAGRSAEAETDAAPASSRRLGGRAASEVAAPSSRRMGEGPRAARSPAGSPGRYFGTDEAEGAAQAEGAPKPARPVDSDAFAIALPPISASPDSATIPEEHGAIAAVLTAPTPDPPVIHVIDADPSPEMGIPTHRPDPDVEHVEIELIPPSPLAAWSGEDAPTYVETRETHAARLPERAEEDEADEVEAAPVNAAPSANGPASSAPISSAPVDTVAEDAAPNDAPAPTHVLAALTWPAEAALAQRDELLRRLRERAISLPPDTVREILSRARG